MANNVELLKQYKELLDQGILTQEEFEEKRRAVLAEMQQTQEKAPDPVSPPASPVQPTANQTNPSNGESTFLWAVLGFFIPIVGLILYLVWKEEYPQRAKSAGKGALIGVIVSVVVGIIYGIVIGSMAGSYYY